MLCSLSAAFPQHPEHRGCPALRSASTANTERAWERQSDLEMATEMGKQSNQRSPLRPLWPNETFLLRRAGSAAAGRC